MFSLTDMKVYQVSHTGRLPKSHFTKPSPSPLTRESALSPVQTESSSKAACLNSHSLTKQLGFRVLGSQSEPPHTPSEKQGLFYMTITSQSKAILHIHMK